MHCGLWTALVLNVFVGVAVSYCMCMLVNSAKKMYGRVKVPMMSYPDMAEATVVSGPWDSVKKYRKEFRYTVDLIICIDLFGTCCVYQVMIAKSIKQLVDKTEDFVSEGHPPIRIYIIMLLLPCMLICMITSLKYLAPFSILADIVIMTAAGATVYYGTEVAATPPTDFPIFKTASGLFEFIGVCAFSVEGVGATMSIENNMTNPEKMPVVIIAGMTIVVSLVMIVGFFGYWGFGENSQSPITLNFPMTPFPLTIKASLVIMVWVTFAINFWIPFSLVWHYISKKYSADTHWIWDRFYRGIFVTIITAIAVCLPNISKLMGLLGAFCLSNIGFIFPALIELSLDWTEPGLGFLKWRLIKAISICTFGCILFVAGTFSNAKELILQLLQTEKTSWTW